jgi:hypothetical protein
MNSGIDSFPLIVDQDYMPVNLQKSLTTMIYEDETHGVVGGRIPINLLMALRSELGSSARDVLQKAGSPIMVLVHKTLARRGFGYAFLNSPSRETIIVNHVSPDEAYRWHLKGANLYFGLNRETLDGALGGLLEQLLFYACVPRDMAYIAIFVSRKGNVSEWHYDPVTNYTLQISGEKKWMLRSSRDFDVCSAHDADPSSCELKSGHWMCIPNGCWHKVYTLTDSISITLNIRCDDVASSR